MKTTRMLLGLMMAVVGLAPLPAAGPAPAPASEMIAMERFLDLTEEDLSQLQEVIARLRAMTPAQRAALREEIARFRQLPAGQREQLRQGWGGMPPELQEGWRELMQTATPERRAEIQRGLAEMAPAEKTTYRRRLVEEYLRQKTNPSPTK